MTTRTDAQAILELRGLRKSFRAPGSSGTEKQDAPAVEVLRGINLRLVEGGSLAVLGPSGSGKSTLLSIMGGLERASSGSVLYRGEDLAALGGRRLDAFRNRELGFVFQRHYLLPELSLLDNALLPALAAPGGAKAARPRALALLERVGLLDRLAHRPGELSGGECQRVALARALVNRPRLLLADEPTGALDSVNAKTVADLLSALAAEEGVSLVLATHSRDLADRMARRVSILDGRLSGTAS